jgi:predicted nucleotidyltransferase component of viral defense system
MVSREYLRRSAAATGFRVEALEKVVRLGELAGDISRHPLLGDALVLKGGTPLNLCFSEPRRMSVDLDYNYVRHVDRAAMLEDRPLVIKALTDLATSNCLGVSRLTPTRPPRCPLRKVRWPCSGASA